MSKNIEGKRELRELHIIAYPELYPYEDVGEYSNEERRIARRCFKFIDYLNNKENEHTTSKTIL